MVKVNKDALGRSQKLEQQQGTSEQGSSNELPTRTQATDDLIGSAVIDTSHLSTEFSWNLHDKTASIVDSGKQKSCKLNQHYIEILEHAVKTIRQEKGFKISERQLLQIMLESTLENYKSQTEKGLNAVNALMQP